MKHYRPGIHDITLYPAYIVEIEEGLFDIAFFILDQIAGKCNFPNTQFGHLISRTVVVQCFLKQHLHQGIFQGSNGL